MKEKYMMILKERPEFFKIKENELLSTKKFEGNIGEHIVLNLTLDEKRKLIENNDFDFTLNKVEETFCISRKRSRETVWGEKIGIIHDPHGCM